jgi:hypothetical protein
MINKMMTRLRRLVLRAAIKFAGDESVLEFPKNVRLVGPEVDPTIRLNMLLGFNVSVDKDQVLQVCVTNMYVSSTGDNAYNFINGAAARTVKDASALLALMAAKHILASPAENYERGLAPSLPPTSAPEVAKPDDKTYIN